ncbi:MAG TPA: response regulator [Candidatus Kapabacteria bacterium]|nr:response regulator [Candidatus Kapabacteria bacterium]
MNTEHQVIGYLDKLVLICDDEESYTKFLSKIIDKYLKARVLVATDPGVMFEVLKSENPDLIILDLQMPVMDGEKALKVLREDHVHNSVPVLICSALGFESTIVNLAKLNIDGFIIKPFEATTVIQKIQTILDKQR